MDPILLLAAKRIVELENEIEDLKAFLLERDQIIHTSSLPKPQNKSKRKWSFGL